MSERESEIFAEAEDVGMKYIEKQMHKLEREIKTAPPDINWDRALELVEEMNGYTKWICGEQDRVYKTFKYHAVLKPSGDIQFVQGIIIKR